jgi:hypothetical protein
MDTEFYINKEKDNSHSIIIVIKNFFTSENIDYIYSNLNRMDDWRQGEAFGRPIPRLQKWYNMENKSFSPFWKYQHNRWDSLEYEQWLLDLQNNLFTKLNDSFSYLYDQIPSFRKIQFNSVLINKYRNGQDFIKQHKDDEKIFNDNPSIVSISFGASRDFTFKRILYDVNNVFIGIKEEKDCNEEEKKINIINAGMYFFNSNLLKKYIPMLDNNNAQKEYYLTDIVKVIKKDNNININSYVIEEQLKYQIFGVNTQKELQDLEEKYKNIVNG